MTEEMVNQLINSLMFVESKETKQLMLDSFVKKYGEIPEDYKDAVNVIMEM